MNIEHVLVGSIDQLLKATTSIIENNSDVESQVLFYNNRLDFLNTEISNVVKRKEELEEIIKKEAANFKEKMISLSCNVESLNQLCILLSKDCGVAELKLKELMDNESHE